MTNSSNSTVEPYKTETFEEFLELIGNKNIGNWTLMAQALQVDRKTIWLWKQHPLAKKALNEAIQKSVQEMERVGEKDWRMWREKSKMLGIVERIDSDVTSGGEPINKTDEQLDALIADKLKKLIPQREAGTPETSGTQGTENAGDATEVL